MYIFIILKNIYIYKFALEKKIVTFMMYRCLIRTSVSNSEIWRDGGQGVSGNPDKAGP